MRNIVFIVVIAILGLLAALVFLDLSLFELETITAPPQEVEERVDEYKDFEGAQLLLRRGQPEQALEIIAIHLPQIKETTPSNDRWLKLFIRANEEAKEIDQLRALYEFNPDAFQGQEKASLLVAETYINEGAADKYSRIRQNWRGKENLPHAWKLLDSEKLLLEGKRGQAANLLASESFQGNLEIDRLTRLALLSANDNPKAAWQYLSTAQKKDPDNQEIRFYKGKLLESVGKNNYAAREYETAAAMEPENLFLQDQLAEFYLRQGRHRKAMKIWTDNLQAPTLEMIWIKTLFWSKVLLPVNVDWSRYSRPRGKMAPLIQYLQDLPQGTLWNKVAFSKLPLRDYYLDTQQSTYWLRLIQALKQGHEQEAATLLENSPFATTSWNPELEYVLKQILVYRKKGRLDSRLSPIGLQMESGNEPQLFSQIETFALNPDVEVPDDLHELLLSKEAFSAAFVSSGWYEAGLDLHQLHILPKSFPDWVAVELTKAYKRNRSALDALDFATIQPQNPALRLEIGEIYIAQGDNENALRILNPIVAEQTDIGSRAALLSALIYAEKGDFANAEKTVRNQPLLAREVEGKEILAKAAHERGDIARAREIYETIRDQSVAAKSYLAQSAFDQENWDEAKRLTNELLAIYPGNEQLRQNLDKIEKEQQRTASVK